MSNIVYIASPYTQGDIEENVRKSLEMADELLVHHFIPYPPLLTHYWHQISPKAWEVWLAMDKAILLRCNCVLRMPGFSVGANEEVEFAEKHAIPVYYSLEELLKGEVP